MPRDYSVTIKVRNNRLIEKIREAGYESVAALSRACGVSQGQIGSYIGMKVAPLPYNASKWSPAALRLAECLRCLPEDMFPPAQIRKALEKNEATFTANAADIHQISSSLRAMALPADEKLLMRESKNALDAILEVLPPRERNIINERFGLIDGKEKTLGQIGDESTSGARSVERIRQIEKKALRRLKRFAQSDTRLLDAVMGGLREGAT